ncbi:MAG: hypothetical protein OXM61_22000 [Candidatus Poribacteria bacterium]|nr:hypothetical protein [Candidatus Poribacteria bacterium]
MSNMLVAIEKSKSTLNARMAFSGVEIPPTREKEYSDQKLYTPVQQKSC